MTHPLLQRDTSRPGERRFTSSFDGDELFLRDHRVHGRRILPGAAYIEMARAAAVRAAGLDEQGAVRLHSVLWARPFTVGDQPRDLHIGLRDERETLVRFEVYSEAGSAAGDTATRVVHCRGRAELLGERVDALPPLDIGALSRRCDGEAGAEELYDRFRDAGFDYGPAHRAVVSVAFGQDVVIGRIELPACAEATADPFVVHPSLLDAAFQAAALLPADATQAPVPAVPFAVRETSVAARWSGRMWAVVRREPGSTPRTKALQVNIDLCDERSVSAVRLEGYATRRLPPTFR